MGRSAIIYNSSLNNLVYGLIRQLRTMRFSEKTLHNYLVRLRPIQNYMSLHNLKDYTPKVGLDYYENYINTHTMNTVSKRGLKACILRLNDFYNENAFVRKHTCGEKNMIPNCFKAEAEAFLGDGSIYSNSKRTTRRRIKALARFLSKCTAFSVYSISELTPQIVQIACRDVTDIDEWVTIRQFLKLLAQKGNTDTDLSTFVPKASREKKAPSTYTVDEIRSIEMSIDRSTFQGKRDYVVLLLASRLLIRAGDIATLKVENIDLYKETIRFIQNKTNVEISLPIIPELKKAFGEFLIEADTSDGYLFHTLVAPYEPINGNTVTDIVKKYFAAADIDTTEKKHGPHALRASGSTSMINDNVSYDVVRHALGHVSKNSIRHYAKNDIENLRRCAIVVPLPSGDFAKFLEEGVEA